MRVASFVYIIRSTDRVNPLIIALPTISADQTEPAKPTPNLYERASFAGLDPARGKGHTKLVWLITIQPLSQSGFDFGAGLSSTPCV